jgi:SAM-dependent methyltransferase
MQFASCSAADFVHPDFERIAAGLGTSPPHFHRKLWEYVYVVHHLERLGVLRPATRGLGFGVGTEPLTASFAARGCDIVATDAPGDIAEEAGWNSTRQHGSNLALLNSHGLCDPDEFASRVQHRFVDMNAIDADLTGFDFCWSACCFEHLGSLRHGLDFVVASVEQCLGPGGVAVHTTELNLSSNTDTFESPLLSVYRRRDLDELAGELRSRGHTVSAITVAPDASYLDRYVDVPPYDGDLHLKLELAGHVATSVGIVVQKCSD